MLRKKNKNLFAFSSIIKGKINPSLLIILSDDKCKKYENCNDMHTWNGPFYTYVSYWGRTSIKRTSGDIHYNEMGRGKVCLSSKDLISWLWVNCDWWFTTKKHDRYRSKRRCSFNELASIRWKGNSINLTWFNHWWFCNYGWNFHCGWS